MSKPDYGQVDVVIKNNQPCFYLPGYKREVGATDDTNKLVYAKIFRGSSNFFFLNNIYLDIPNSSNSCLLVSDMKILTDESDIRLEEAYGIG